jgi:chaperone LolA
MKKTVQLFTAALFFLFATVVLAATTTTTPVPAGLTNLLNSIKTMQADFTQSIYDNHGKSVQQTFGNMALQRPGKFRWNVIKPIAQLIIANGSRLWIYDPDLQQLTIRSLTHAAGGTPAVLLSNVDTALEKDFTIKELQSKNTAGWRWFQLIPKKPDNMFESMQIGFQHNQIMAMELTDNLGHVTKIQYQHVKTNIKLAAALFVFKKPANVDVIDDSHQKKSTAHKR